MLKRSLRCRAPITAQSSIEITTQSLRWPTLRLSLLAYFWMIFNTIRLARVRFSYFQVLQRLHALSVHMPGFKVPSETHCLSHYTTLTFLERILVQHPLKSSRLVVLVSETTACSPFIEPRTHEHLLTQDNRSLTERAIPVSPVF